MLPPEGQDGGFRSQDAAPQELDNFFRDIGALIVATSQLDVQISKLISAMAEMGENPAAHFLIHAVDLGRKREIIESYCSMFEGAGLSAISDLRRLNGIVKDVAADRNTVAHGVLRKVSGHLAIESFAATRQFRNTAKELRGQRPAAILANELAAKTKKCFRATELADRLTVTFRALHRGASGTGPAA